MGCVVAVIGTLAQSRVLAIAAPPMDIVVPVLPTVEVAANRLSGGAIDRLFEI
jgi:hypothetical protein